MGGARWSLVVRRAGTIASRTLGLIWVRDLLVGDVMVGGSIRGERLRPLGLSWVAAGRREPCVVREQAGRVQTIEERVGFAEAINFVASLSR
jgi:hypothetical protein